MRVTNTGLDFASIRALPVCVLVAASLLTTLASCPAPRRSYLHPEPTMARSSHAPAAFDGAGGEEYDRIEENAIHSPADRPLSTFSIDVDTAAYANVRRFLRQEQLPPVDAVRIEELINYFDYGYPQPTGDAPFGVVTEVGPAPWNPDRRLVHIGLQGRRIERGAIPPRNLVFLLDVSGSMGAPNKLPLLKQAFRMLVDQLTWHDRVSIVVYAGASGTVLPPTRGDQKQTILSALDRLNAGGSTNGGAGIQLAYALAQQHFDADAINRVILATDGDFNVGITGRDSLIRMIEDKRRSGVYLTVLGFGMGNLKDSSMEQLADKGNGNYAYIDSAREAQKVLVAEASGTLVTIAKDVKIQVAFNPERVASYRLIGYENRVMADRDFADDSKDAGEIGAGHTVTALYEVELKGAGSTVPLLSVNLRYKQPDSDTSVPMQIHVDDHGADLGQTSTAYRFSAAVAGFGMLLRRSPHAGAASYHTIADLARGALGGDARGYRREFLELVGIADRLTPEAAVRAGRAE